MAGAGESSGESCTLPKQPAALTKSIAPLLGSVAAATGAATMSAGGLLSAGVLSDPNGKRRSPRTAPASGPTCTSWSNCPSKSSRSKRASGHRVPPTMPAGKRGRRSTELLLLPHGGSAGRRCSTGAPTELADGLLTARCSRGQRMRAAVGVAATPRLSDLAGQFSCRLCLQVASLVPTHADQMPWAFSAAPRHCACCPLLASAA